MLDQPSQKGSLQKVEGGMLASVVTKTVESGLNPETSTRWLVTWASLLLCVLSFSPLKTGGK